jgi:hypothetical protein
MRIHPRHAHGVILQLGRAKHQNTCEIRHRVASAVSLAKAEAKELVLAAYFNFATTYWQNQPFHLSHHHHHLRIFEQTVDLQGICGRSKLSQINVYGVPPFTSNIIVGGNHKKNY